MSGNQRLWTRHMMPGCQSYLLWEGEAVLARFPLSTPSMPDLLVRPAEEPLVPNPDLRGSEMLWKSTGSMSVMFILLRALWSPVKNCSGVSAVEISSFSMLTRKLSFRLRLLDSRLSVASCSLTDTISTHPTASWCTSWVPSNKGPYIQVSDITPLLMFVIWPAVADRSEHLVPVFSLR